VDKLILAYKLPKLNAIVCNRALDKYNERALVIWERYLLG
jgi:hypothetical protein